MKSFDPGCPEQPQPRVLHERAFNEPHHAEHRNYQYAWFLGLLLAVPAIATLLCILLGKSDYFLHHGASVWVQSNDAVFDLSGLDCKLLIFGDSTAMTGIDPTIVQQRTGLKTCNISVTNSVLSVTNTLALDHYLAHNARPDFILVQLSPESFQTGSQRWDTTIYTEGILELLRHSSTAESRAVLWSHPKEALTFAGYAAGFSAWYALRAVVYSTTHIALQNDTIQIHNGFFTPPSPARTHCETMENLPEIGQKSSAQMVAAAYQRYAHPGTVLVDVAPIPACDRNLESYRNELLGVTNNTLRALPIQFFNDQRHFTANGSRILSAMVADQVNTATGHPANEMTAGLVSSLASHHADSPHTVNGAFVRQ